MGGTMRLIVTLTCISLISAAALAFVNGVTREPIAEADRAKKLKAITAVLPPGVANRPDQEAFEVATADGRFQIYPGRDGAGRLLGLALQSWTDMGFSGRFDLMLGVDGEGRIAGVEVLKHAETPGLGSKMTERAFTAQFLGKGPDTRFAVRRDGGEIDAITAATISSRAFGDAVRRGMDAAGAGRRLLDASAGGR